MYDRFPAEGMTGVEERDLGGEGPPGYHRVAWLLFSAVHRDCILHSHHPSRGVPFAASGSENCSRAALPAEGG